MQLKLQTKLLLGFITVALIGAVIGIWGIVSSRSLASSSHYMFDYTATPLQSCVNFERAFLNIRVNLMKELLSTDQATGRSCRENVAGFKSAITKEIKVYSETFIDDTDRSNFNAFVAAYNAYLSILEINYSFIDQGRKNEAVANIFSSAGNGFIVASAKVQSTLDTVTEYNVKSGERISDENAKLGDFTTISLVLATVVAFIVSILLAVWLGVFTVARPLQRISETLSKGSVQIKSASVQLSSASQEIANGATEQASSIEETTSSMEELASMVKQNVGNAKESSILADKASQSAQVGHVQMEKMLESMADINNSSDQIKNIIKVIDEIAFQTNMLALNAAVEAARAGEAGMGFAVVADEVKNLANRSASAAKETAAMIEGSIKKTMGGLDIANKLAEVFQEILVVNKKVSEMAREVETASRQQDTGIEQVNKALVQFDEVIQANASSSEETASAAEELQTQVETLNEMVGQLSHLITGKKATKKKKKAVVVDEDEDEAVVVRPLAKKKAPRLEAPGRRPAASDLVPFEDDEEFKAVN